VLGHHGGGGQLGAGGPGALGVRDQRPLGLVVAEVDQPAAQRHPVPAELRHPVRLPGHQLQALRCQFDTVQLPGQGGRQRRYGGQPGRLLALVPDGDRRGHRGGAGPNAKVRHRGQPTGLGEIQPQHRAVRSKIMTAVSQPGPDDGVAVPVHGGGPAVGQGQHLDQRPRPDRLPPMPGPLHGAQRRRSVLLDVDHDPERLIAERQGLHPTRLGSDRPGRPDHGPENGRPGRREICGCRRSARATLARVLPRITATAYLTPLREGGSLPAIMEADDLGTYVVKFTGAGQGVKALVAEIVVAELARRIGLRTPELALIEVSKKIARTEPDQEVQHLVAASAGTNLAVDFLPGAIGYDRGILAVDPEVASAVVWLDAWTANVDRSARNTNLLIWHGDL